MMAASKTLVPHVCGKEHETVGMGVVTSELSRCSSNLDLIFGVKRCSLLILGM